MMSMYGRKKAHTNMDILYLLLPIIGAFLLLFLVCCFGKKVKEMLHIPKELVLGRNFPGLASSTSTSTSSSRSSFSDSDDDATTQEPALVINMNVERQRVMSQHRRRYTQVATDEMVFSLHSEVDCHTQPAAASSDSSSVGQSARGAPSRLALYRLPILTNLQHVHRKYKNQQKRADSCPLLSRCSDDGAGHLPAVDVTSYVNVAHAPYRLHPLQQHGMLRVGRQADLDSDCDIPSTVVTVAKLDRRRHRSNSESDLPKRGAEYEDAQCDFLLEQRLSQFSHRLSSTEFQLHATQDCNVIVQTDCEQCSTSQAEVG